jgi:CheY-like chemotaxis protein
MIPRPARVVSGFHCNRLDCYDSPEIPASLGLSWPSPRTNVSHPAGHHGWRIIATDRDKSKLDAFTEILRDAGHCVVPVQDGRSALQLTLELPRIDLLVTNTRLGGMDGHLLIHLVRYMRPNVRILHLVENGGDNAPPDVLSLREPFTADQLLTAVGSLCA